MYCLLPSLIELCRLSPRKDLEGLGLKPLLDNPNAKWERPSLTTHGRNNHALRSDRFRYIRYADGSEELYDHRSDPMEWKNLADNPKLDKVKQDHAKWLPTENVPELGKLTK